MVKKSTFGQNAINHLITTLIGAGVLALAGYYLWINIKDLNLEQIGIASGLALLGLVLIGAKDRISLFGKTYGK